MGTGMLTNLGEKMVKEFRAELDRTRQEMLAARVADLQAAQAASRATEAPRG